MAQKRLLTWILLVLAGAMVIFAGILAYVATTFDPNDYKGRLSATVADRYQRTLSIDGDLALSVFPNVEITLPHTSLSEPESKAIAAEVNGARVSLALLPLVSHELRVGAIVLDGVKAVVTKSKDGALNFDDLLGTRKKAERHTQRSGKEDDKELGSFDVDGIQLTNSAFTYRDLGTGKELALSRVNLTVGRLAALSAVPLELSLHCESKDPATTGDLDIRGQINLDLQSTRYGAETLTLAYNGTVKGSPLAAEIKVDGLDWTTSAFSANALTVTTKRGGPDNAEVALAFTTAHGSPQAVDVERFSATIRTAAAATGKKSAIDLNSPLTVNLDTQTFVLKKVDGRVTLDNPTAAAKLIEMTLTGHLEVMSKEEKVKGAIGAALDESTIDATIDLSGFAKPAIGFDVAINAINLDRYTSQATPAQAAEKREPAKPEKEAPIDLSALKGFSLDGGVKIGALQVHGIKAQDVTAKIALKNGQLQLAPMIASLYEGGLDAKAGIDANSNRFSFAPKLIGIQVGPLLRDAAKLDKIEGKGNVALDVTAQGQTVTAIKQALAGTASVRLADGEIKGFDYGKRLAGWRDKLTSLGTAANEGVASSDQEKTVFSELSASFIITKGVATNKDLTVKAPLVRLGGEGDIDIGHDALDYTVKASVVNTLTGQGGKSIGQAKDLTVPVRVHGPYNKIAYDIRWSAVSSAALKSLATPKIEEQKKLLQDKAPEQLRGTLQGLFNR